MRDFKAFISPFQSFHDVMFFNAAASPGHLFETAQQRMTAVIDLLQMVEQAGNADFVQHEAAQLAFAVGLLLGDARTLYEAAHDRAVALSGAEAMTCAGRLNDVRLSARPPFDDGNEDAGGNRQHAGNEAEAQRFAEPEHRTHQAD